MSLRSERCILAGGVDGNGAYLQMLLGNITINLLFQIKLNSQLWMETRLTTAAYTLTTMICRINVQVSP